MTDTQPPKHSPREIAVNSTRYTYMRRAMIIPTCVVQICSLRMHNCFVVV